MNGFEREPSSPRSERQKRRIRRARARRGLLALLLAALVLGGVALTKAARGTQDPSPSASSLPDAEGSLPAEPKLSDEPQAPPEVPSPDRADPPQASPSDTRPWYLTLVNPWNPLPEDWDPVIVPLADGQSVDARISAPLTRFMNDAEAAGFRLTLASGYRTTEKQQSILDTRVDSYIEGGMSREEACAEAARWVAQPGYSEHQLGLAADLNGSGDGPTSDDIYAWLAENCFRYGFILRYPADKTDLTGTAYEPWHFRYVGEEAAAAIHEQGLCLEEYLAENGF